MDELLLLRSSLVEVALDLLESGIVLHAVQPFLQASYIVFDLLLLDLQPIQSLRTGVRVVVGLQYFFDLVEQLDGNSLAMLSITAFHFLEESQFVGYLLDVLQILVIDGLDVLQPTLLFVVYYVVLRLQLLHLVGYLQLQGRVFSKVLEQLIQTFQVLCLKIKPRVHLSEIFVNFVKIVRLF